MVAAGSPSAGCATKLPGSLPFGVEPLDKITFLAMCGAMILAASRRNRCAASDCQLQNWVLNE